MESMQDKFMTTVRIGPKGQIVIPKEVRAMFGLSDVDGSAVGGYDAVALGCPAMGSEVLEDMEFEPMFDGCKSSLKGKRVALFGSYGWGGGEWMHNWERDCRSSGIQLACDSVICNEAPDDAALAACQALGKALVG